jgi:hypothetical protein
LVGIIVEGHPWIWEFLVIFLAESFEPRGLELGLLRFYWIR